VLAESLNLFCRWVYEDDLCPYDEKHRQKQAELVPPPRKGRKSLREDGEGAAKGSKKQRTEPAENNKGKVAIVGKWMDAVEPEVKSELSREERKLQADMERIQKLEARTKAETDARSEAACRQHCEEQESKRRHKDEESVDFRSRSQPIALKQGADKGGAIAPCVPNTWPVSVYMLKTGVNDSWNSYQVVLHVFDVLYCQPGLVHVGILSEADAIALVFHMRPVSCLMHAFMLCHRLLTGANK
jgi:hypothetical protein